MVVFLFVFFIFIYSLKMVFGSFFALISNAYLPSQFSINYWSEVPVLFQTFAVGFGSMALIMMLLFWRAVKLGSSLGFSAIEIDYAKFKRQLWSSVVMFSAFSFLLSMLIPARPESGIWIGMPGFIFFILNLVQIYMRRRYIKKSSGSQHTH